MALKARRSCVRAVDASDAAALVRLHRELWFDHDARGGMPASRDDAIWELYAGQLRAQLAHRCGRKNPTECFEGKTGHLVVEYDGVVVGQLEISAERFGWNARTPVVAELRSLIVARSHRGLGLGAALVRQAAAVARDRSGMRTLIGAEVLAANEALSFYDRLGFRTVERMLLVRAPPPVVSPVEVRPAEVADAPQVAVIDVGARGRRHEWGDPRFDPPPTEVSSEFVRMIEAGLAAEALLVTDQSRGEWVAQDATGHILASAYCLHAPLGVPFAPVTRAEVTRLSADPDQPEAVAAAFAIVRHTHGIAVRAGAPDLLVRTPFLDPIGASLAQQPGTRPFSWILIAPVTTLLAGTEL